MTPTGKNFFILMATIAVIVLVMIGYFVFGHRRAFAPADLKRNNSPADQNNQPRDNPPATGNNDKPVSCTMEAKVCPDGSAVGRTGPNCEFAACPGEKQNSDSGIFGTATLGPTCPVVRPDTEDQCKDKPFTGQLIILNSNTQKEIKRFSPSALGEFRVPLAAGNYTIISSPEKILPRCSKTVIVAAKKFTETTIHCDTGIR